MLSEPACPVGRAKSASGGEDVGWLMEDERWKIYPANPAAAGEDGWLKAISFSN
jgi:hypothetical protein